MHLFNTWKRVADEHKDDGTLVLVCCGDDNVVTFVQPVGLWYMPAYQNMQEITKRLDGQGIEWVLVNAPDDVAAACGVVDDMTGAMAWEGHTLASC